MNVSKRVIYSGNVQGVGFRYTARGVARHFPVGGYVRNLPDGTVELVAEGTAEQVEGFLQAVANHMRDHIHQQTVNDQPPRGHDVFEIRH
jgi:acylphosphatase